MGAFTLKPFAFGARPWELTQVEAFNYLQASLLEPDLLRFQLFANVQVFRVQCSDWVLDRVRFIGDGLRRQRVTSVWLGLRKKSWPAGLSLWWSLTVGHTFWHRCDAWLANHAFAQRLYRTVQRGRRMLAIVFDFPAISCVYHGIYGFIGLNKLAGLILPACHPYEEDKVITPPTGIPLWVTWATALTNLSSWISDCGVSVLSLDFLLRHKVSFHSANLAHGVSFTSRVSCYPHFVTLV